MPDEKPESRGSKTCALSSLVGERGADADVAKARGGGAVSGAHGLHGLPFPAVGRPPQSPMLTVADGVARIPEFGGNATVARILEHARFLAALDPPADFGGKLKLISPVVDGPR